MIPTFHDVVLSAEVDQIAYILPGIIQVVRLSPRLFHWVRWLNYRVLENESISFAAMAHPD